MKARVSFKTDEHGLVRGSVNGKPLNFSCGAKIEITKENSLPVVTCAFESDLFFDNDCIFEAKILDSLPDKVAMAMYENLKERFNF